MQKTQATVATPKAAHARRSVSQLKTKSNGSASRTNPPLDDFEPASLSFVTVEGVPTHVQMSVEDYERLLDRVMAFSAVAKLNDPNTEWISAKQAGLQLAGLEISEARKAAGLTQKQLGDKLGLPQSQISRIERSPDHTTVRTMKKIAKALGVDVSALVR